MIPERVTPLAAALLTATLLTAGPGLAHDPAKPHQASGHGDASGHRGEMFDPGPATRAGGRSLAAATVDTPLYDGLGALHFTVTTAVPEAQAYFDQGLRWTWAFNHGEALRSFRQARRLDPDCALCWWGEAFVLGPNINDAMRPEAVAPAHAAITRARALKPGATRKERGLIEALAGRYSADPDADRAALDLAWAEAMAAVAERYPEDADLQVLYADALMNTQPWDYWEADGRRPKGRGGEIVATLERALEIAPHHPAALHLYIHAVEASADPGRAEFAADRLRGAVPAAGHLVHMPAHIYTRIGRHRDSIAVNRDAIAADEAFLARAGAAASPLYRFGYYPHNVHFLMVSAQMAGVRADVLATAAKLAEVTSDQVAQELAWVQAIKTAPYSAHAQFSDPETILALADPGERFPLVKGFWLYARGGALARLGRAGAARDQLAALDTLIAESDWSGLEAQYLPARDVLGIARSLVAARIARAGGDLEAAVRHAEAAVALQDGLPYMEPPYWYYPVRQTLGAMLLQAGRAGEAVAAFAQALRRAPRNGWALWGLAQAQRALGDEAAAAASEAALDQAWLGDPALLSLSRL